MLKKTSVLTIIFVLMLVLSGCGVKVVEDTVTYSLAANVSVVELLGYNGEIRWVPIRGDEQPRIDIVKYVFGSDTKAMEQFLKLIHIQNNSTADKVTFRVEQPKLPYGVEGSAIQFVVYASPEMLSQFMARTSNGSIYIDATFKGYLDLQTSNGDIILSSGVGEVRARTSNGHIKFNETTLTGQSVLETSNGQIAGNLALSSTGNFKFVTSNGDVELNLPYHTKGAFDIEASNGKIEFSLGSRWANTEHKALSLSLSSDPKIEISASNGNVIVLGGWKDLQ